MFVRLEVVAGKEDEVERMLASGLGVVAEEPATPLWFAIKFGPSTFGVFDAFENESGRQAHLAGKLAAALLAKAPEVPRVRESRNPGRRVTTAGVLRRRRRDSNPRWVAPRLISNQLP